MQPLSILHKLSVAVAATRKLEKIYQILLTAIVQSMKVERASIMRYDREAKALRIVAARGIPSDLWKTMTIKVGKGFSGKVFQSNRPLLVKSGISKDRYKTKSFLIFPMRVGKTPIGVINLTDKRSGKPFAKTDLQLLTTVANQVAAYVHLCDLLVEREKSELLRSQVEIARQIQQSLLPEQAPRFPGVELAGILLPAERVGADYYDFIPIGKTRLGVCVADVSGHHVGGALLAAALRSTLRAEAGEGRGPAETITTVGKILWEDLAKAEQFLTLAYAEFQNRGRLLRLTTAGHPPILWWRSKTKTVQTLRTNDPILGLSPRAKFHEKKVLLSAGDLLFFHSDGLNLNPDWLKVAGNLSAREMLNAILLRWEQFSGKKPPKDDVTLVVMKVL